MSKNSSVVDQNEDFHSVQLALEPATGANAASNTEKLDVTIQQEKHIENVPTEAEPHKFSRTEIGKVASQMLQIIENCSTFHKSLVKDLVPQNLSYDQLAGCQTQL